MPLVGDNKGAFVLFLKRTIFKNFVEFVAVLLPFSVLFFDCKAHGV